MNDGTPINLTRLNNERIDMSLEGFIFASPPVKVKKNADEKTCPKCRGSRSGMKLHLAATAAAGKPMFTWEYCNYCGGRGSVHSSRG